MGRLEGHFDVYPGPPLWSVMLLGHLETWRSQNLSFSLSSAPPLSVLESLVLPETELPHL